MKPRIPSNPIAWGAIILMGMAVLLPAQELPAQSAGCLAVDQYDMPRDCTFLEEHGACLWNALDSRETCKDGADGFWENAACEVGVQVDLLACNFGLPWRLIRAVID